MDEVKYSSEQDNFDFKFKIFQNYCLRAGVPKQAYIIAIPTILHGLALKYYFYLDIESCPSYHSDPKAEAFWTEFVKGEG
jgi:hypothetical protein